MLGFGISPFSGSRGGLSFGDWGNGWSKRPNPIVAADFVNRRYINFRENEIVTLRNSEAWAQRVDGVFQNYGVNVPRIVPGRGLLTGEQRTNSVRNPRGNGGTVGVVGSGGQLPTNWSLTTSGGMQNEFLGEGVENGLPGVYVRFFGTASATSFQFSFEHTSSITAAQGQVWNISFGVRLSAGSLGDIQVDNSMVEQNGGSVLTSQNTQIVVDNTLRFHSTTYTVGSATANNIRHRPRFRCTSGATYDFTLFLTSPLARQGTFAGNPILNPAGVTNSATVQQADEIRLPISGFGSAFTLYAEIDGVITGASRTILSASLGAGLSNNARILHSSGGALQAQIRVGGSVVQTVTGPALNTASPNRVAVSVNGTSIIVSANGAAAVTAATGTAPAAPDRLYIGGNSDGTSQINIFKRRFEAYAGALNGSELQALTA